MTENRDRRVATRTPACIAIELNSEEKRGRCGVARNKSESGLLVVTPSRFGVGDRLVLQVHEGNVPKRIAGRVRRVEETALDSPELWRWRLAIEFDKTG